MELLPVCGIFDNGSVVLCIEASHLTFPRIGSASVGIIVRNLATGKDEVVENADKLMTPASILKCVTAAATLMNNGSDK